MSNDRALSLFDRLSHHFGKDGRLSAVHQAELAAIRDEGDISKDDQFWLWFLPIYLTQARLDFLKEADGGSAGKLQLDLDKLAVAIAARIEPDQIRAEVDSAVIARAVAKAAASDIQSVVEEAMAGVQKPASVPLDPATIHAAVKQASKDAFLNRNLIVAVLAGLLMSIFAGWFSGWQSDKRWEEIVQQQKQQIQQMQGGHR